jgi:hypothetical protein
MAGCLHPHLKMLDLSKPWDLLKASTQVASSDDVRQDKNVVFEEDSLTNLIEGARNTKELS